MRTSKTDVPGGPNARAAGLSRRDLVAGAALLPLLAGLVGTSGAAMVALAQAQTPAGKRFDAFTVRQIARDLAGKPFVAPDPALPAELDQLSYDDYRRIRFIPERAIWNGEALPFQMQLFSRGFLFRERVNINIVDEGMARAVVYSPDLFRFDDNLPRPDLNTDLGFSGFRLHTPINRPDYYDEVAVFQGASYFRAIARGQVYGSSARGLSVRTGDPRGEEFPLFKEFWVERPKAGMDSVVVHALLDSVSATAAFRFTIRPGDVTGMAVEVTVYPRVDLDHVGLGTLTSMFLFAPNDRDGIDDFRPAVHDAAGLAIINGRGEHLWRPLINPGDLQTSVFVDNNPRGFGLSQRQRAFFDYNDLETRYEKRPTIWVEPIGDWGEGAVTLLEIPTAEEIHDNVVVFWRPKSALSKGGEYSYTYRMNWAWDEPEPFPLARFAQTSIGGTEERRLFVIDLVGERLQGIDLASLKASVSAGAGKINHLVLQPNPEIKGLRMSFVLEPEGAAVVELRAQIMQNDAPASEVWVYRWTR